MSKEPFNNDDVKELSARFMQILNIRWIEMSVPDDQKIFNFDEIYNAACIETPPITSFDSSNNELRYAVENNLKGNRRIEFINGRQIRRLSSP